MTPPKEKLNASDVLNWNYLLQIAAKPDSPTPHLSEAIPKLAYALTSAASEETQNEELVEALKNATDGQSRETAERVVMRLAQLFQSDPKLLRRFAKENGIRLPLFTSG